MQIGDYIGPGYARVSAACTEAIRMAAELEGLLLDPVHTGKVMAGIIDHARSASFVRARRYYSYIQAGLPELFNFAEELRRPRSLRLRQGGGGFYGSAGNLQKGGQDPHLRSGRFRSPPKPRPFGGDEIGGCVGSTDGRPSWRALQLWLPAL